jgi:DNA-binding NarL/FixJ family response regulator
MAFGDIPNETSPARLLIVEDDVLVASSLDELLSASGFDVVGIAGSAATAASLAGERHPQLALIDIRLVGPIDGIELACHFREQFRIPTIFLSGFADQETKERALLAKPLGFLPKPYRASQVFNLIDRALSEACP